ncbi:hypothetical protein J2847_006758 [Azospirillum agricola]|uniref:hypothetical protein n=1 Tax=Azospirillum agricola TaxID=1720247 RepID=UPI001AE27532|nr:hypothetical protein [Azospirillum agricola]MBP2233420.1 hypothetical protein [Azospirillum agricola]
MITISEAVARHLSAQTLPLITDYQLFLILRALYRAKEQDGEAIRIKRSTPTIDSLTQTVKRLVASRHLAPDPDFGKGVYTVTGSPAKPAEEVCCLVDPFCHIAYLSAMQRHGITNRHPDALHLASPALKLWGAMRDDRMRQDYGSLAPGGTAMPLQRLAFPDTIRRRPVRRHTSRHPGAWRQVRGSWARVATIGQTFLDTLEAPDRCGGMAHVIEVWEEHASTFLEEIVAAVDTTPVKLAKVRAGYLLQERLGLGLGDRRIDGWKSFAQRGGSQKLDPEADYAPVFSETWMLSLNAAS